MLQNQAFDEEHRKTRPKGRGAKATAPDSVSPADGGPVRIGVVIVHGVGQQAPSETVRWFGDALYDWVTRWFRARVHAGLIDIGNVELSYGDALGGTPARYELSIPAVGIHPRQTWVLAEGYWADRVSPPSLLTMLKWGLGAILPTFFTLMRNAVTAPIQRRTDIQKVLVEQKASGLRQALAFLGSAIDFLSQALLLVGYVLIIGAGGVLLILLVVPAIVPIKQVQDFVLFKILAPILTEFIGDFQVYTTDPLVSQHMRNGVTRAITWLVGPQGRCTTVCVIGHSGGALIAYDAVMNGLAADVAAVTKLFTVGSALNQASRQERDTLNELGKRWPDADLRPRQFGGKTRDIQWADIWSAYDPVALGRFIPDAGIAGPENIPATNEMNLITDHGAYFRNDEEVTSLLAQEISTPTTTRDNSRFWLEHSDQRALRRWERVITLVGWRVFAMYLFALVVLRRWDDLPDAGRRVWAVLDQIPGLQGIAGILGGAFEAIGRAVGYLAEATAGLGAFAPLAWLSDHLQANAREMTASGLLAAALIGALFGFVYWGLTSALYEPWRRAERARSVEEKLPPRKFWQSAFVWLRAIAIPAVLVTFGLFLLTA